MAAEKKSKENARLERITKLKNEVGDILMKWKILLKFNICTIEICVESHGENVRFL